ncbi:hypothetical protein [Lacrimispora indolis]|uniref:hypothetical protein n=1 Tax=Lacrimispora indolis TaxID=69825 RepID=UPI0003FA935E|nr:hypothetical protein [[Clostridium] methoxybenzovorans]
MKFSKALFSVAIIAALSAFSSIAALAADNEATTETVSIETVPYDANASRELIDTVYFKSENGNTIMSDTPFETQATRAQSNNVMTGSIDYYNDGIDNQGRPGYTVTATIYSTNLNIKSSRLMTRAENVSSWNTNNRNHTGRVAVNSRSFVYTSNPPSNPYCEARLWVTDSEDFETYIGYTRLTNAK